MPSRYSLDPDLHRAFIASVRSSENPDDLAILSLAFSDVPPPNLKITTREAEALLRSCGRGDLPDLLLLADAALTDRTPRSDFRWVMYEQARRSLHASLDAGRVLGPPEIGQHVAAIQVLVDERETVVRVNGAIIGTLGVLMNRVSPESDRRWHVELEWGMPGPRRDVTHITVLHGRVNGRIGALVLWNNNPSVIRRASPEQLLRMMSNSVPPQARARWRGLSHEVDGDMVRSIAWEAEAEGILPDAMGGVILERVEGLVREGLPSRREQSSVMREADLGEAAERLLDSASRVGGGAETLSPEHAVIEAETREEAVLRLDALRAVASPDECKLIDALRAGWADDPGSSRAEIARQSGWHPADVEAVLKRLARRAQRTDHLTS